VATTHLERGRKLRPRKRKSDWERSSVNATSGGGSEESLHQKASTKKAVMTGTVHGVGEKIEKGKAGERRKGNKQPR